MRIRLTGTRTEIDATVAVLRQVLDITKVSDFYPNPGSRHHVGRVYLHTIPAVSGTDQAEGDDRR